ncbi:MAG: uroporphyrinogen decarboxylase family protein [Limisphaerales bacterium]|jgi:uroporphyrinogen decarboxylase
MTTEEWNIIKKCALCEETGESVPVALIIDSPWIPGYLGISTIDYIQIPQVWLDANLAVERQFEEIIFIPGFWAEAGMATEPSGFGCKVSFYHDRTPEVHPILKSVEEVDRLVVPNPKTDGLMPFILNTYKKCEPIIRENGHSVKIVCARGPLTIATHLLGVTQFLLDLKLDPSNTHKLLKITTQFIKDWLSAQAESLSEVEGIMILDDIVGFLSPKDYLEFAHPYLKEIFSAFPQCVKIFHNDNFNPSSYKYLGELGVQIFNFTHLTDIKKARELVGENVCLMGNVPPLEVLARGNVEDVIKSAINCIQLHNSRKGLILSAGGGTSPGTPAENIRALARAAKLARVDN